MAGNATSMSPARVATSRDTVGSEATGPNRPGWARTTARSATQSPPRATASARSVMILPGSCRARTDRHGVSACDSNRVTPQTRTTSRSSTPPAEDTNASRAGSTTRFGTALRFTYGVPFRSDPCRLRNHKTSKQDRHFRALHAEHTPARRNHEARACWSSRLRTTQFSHRWDPSGERPPTWRWYRFRRSGKLAEADPCPSRGVQRSITPT